MLALRWVDKDKVLLTDVEVPKIKTHEILVKVKSASICGTDLHIVNKGFPGMNPPVTLGHEFSGVVAETGSQVTSLHVGQRVAVEPIRLCHKCEYCTDGNYDLCLSFEEAGFSYDGGMAEYVVADARHVYPLPEEVSFPEASVLEPLGNIVRAVERGRVQGAKSVLVIGDGFEGLVFAQLAKKMGVPQVIVVGHHEFKLEIAKNMGADYVINGKKEDPVTAVLALTNERGSEVVFEAAGTTLSIQNGLALTKRGGRMVLFGVCNDLVPLNVYKVMQEEIEIIGSVGHAKVWEKSIELIRSQYVDVKPYIEIQRSFGEAEKAFEEMSERKVKAIKVILNMGDQGGTSR